MLFIVLFINTIFKPFNKKNKKQYVRLLGIIIVTYTIIPSVPKMSIIFNYVTWFCIIYLIGAFIRMYGEEIAFLSSSVGIKWLTSFFVAICSIVVGTCFSDEIHSYYWYFVTDFNKLLALLPAVFAFLWFKDLKIKYSKMINSVAASTFGVLMIHANSDTMRTWLWKDVLHNVQMYKSNYFVIHMFVSTIGIFIICTIIDMARIKFLERPYLKLIDKVIDRHNREDK